MSQLGWNPVHDNPTSVLMHACRLQLHNSCTAHTMLALPHGLSHWLPCHCCLVPLHAEQTRREETICLHTWKGVIFKPDEHSPDIFCIPTKSLAAYHPNKYQLIWQWWITQSRADGIWAPNVRPIDQLDEFAWRWWHYCKNCGNKHIQGCTKRSMAQPLPWSSEPF